MRKGQLSLEFMFAIGVLMALLIVISLIVADQKQRVLAKQDELGSRNDCLALADAIVGAFDNPGSDVNITLRHDASVQARERVIDVGDVVCTLPVNTVTNGTMSSFTLAAGPVVVTSSDNSVVVRNE